MQELINELAAKADLTPEQAAKTVEVIKDFIKQKFPMFEGMVDNLFV
jgi:nucleoid DNA-binding protein